MRPCGTFDRSYAQDMAIFRTRFQWLVLIMGLLFLFGVFPQFASNYLISVANMIGITIIAAHGLNILTGACGLISLGHAAFVAVGAYISAMLTQHLGLSFWAALPCAAIGTGLVGLIFGLPSLRVKGFYIAVTTLAAHFIIIWAISHGGTLTGGTEGLFVPAINLGGMVFASERQFFFLIMGFVVLMTFFAKNLLRTRVGRAFVAIRDDDIAAEFTGINIFHYKVLAFFIGTAFAGVAGSLYAHYIRMLTPEYFSFMESVWYVGYIIVGGMGSVAGTIFGVIFLKLLAQAAMIAGPIVGNAIPAISSGAVSGFMQISFGVIIILFLVFEPRGLNHRWNTAKALMRIWPFSH